MFRSSVQSTVLLTYIILLVSATALASKYSKCRFSPQYSQDEILKNSNAFVWDMLFWEGHFHQNDVGYNSANGMSYDGTLLDPVTGLNNVHGKHPFSAASKESLQIMVYTHAIAGDSRAARFLSPMAPEDAPSIAMGIMSQKLEAYLKFNETYPGFGGFLPWFLSNETDLQPTSDWVNRVPALDNGELIWAVYSAVQVLEGSSDSSFQILGRKWQHWLDYTKVTAAHVFYNGTGRVCAVTTIGNQSIPINGFNQSYTCEGTSVLNDPYEGELFTWWLYLFSPLLTPADKSALWALKRPQLVSIDWHSNTSSIGDITVQKGFWFSSHEQWKVLEMPYYDVPLVKRVYHNAERVRTCNSFLMQNPGMYASVNNITDSTGQIIGYISNAGIPNVANQTIQELDVVTPYSVFPTILFNESVGLAWWKNMADGKGMQNPYGSTESERVDWKGISSFVSWDSKITIVNALLGGVTKFVREKMKADGVYEEFLRVTQREYGRVFGAGGEKLKGKDVNLCLPEVKVPVTGSVEDYTMCR